MKIMIRYGDGSTAGNGHRVRMQRLAKVLGQRGAEVNIQSANFVEILDSLKRTPYDVLVMDVPENNNRELEAFRPHITRLAVIVGVGHTIDTETSWIADTVIYQNMREWIELIEAPSSMVLYGAEYLMVDPYSVSWRQSKPGTSIMTYFGAGFPANYAAGVTEELRRRMSPEIEVVDAWDEQWVKHAARAGLVVASMGMAVNEAVAVGTDVVTISVDDEHAEDAEELCELASVLHVGTYASVSPNALAKYAAKRYLNVERRPDEIPIDGMGVYRVARALLS